MPDSTRSVPQTYVVVGALLVAASTAPFAVPQLGWSAFFDLSLGSVGVLGGAAYVAFPNSKSPAYRRSTGPLLLFGIAFQASSRLSPRGSLVWGALVGASIILLVSYFALLVRGHRLAKRGTPDEQSGVPT